MLDEIARRGWSVSGSNDVIAQTYDELRNDPSLWVDEPGDGPADRAAGWAGGIFGASEIPNPYGGGYEQSAGEPRVPPPAAPGDGGYAADPKPRTRTPTPPPAQQFEYGQPMPLSPEQLLAQQMEADAARKEAEALEYEREQAEEEAALAIERALTGKDCRDLSDDELKYLDYGGF
jgi:hypothetical protein